MNADADLLQKGLLGLLGTIIAGLGGWRLFTRVKTDNASDARNSRFEENLQKRYEAAMGKISQLQEELQKARDGKTLLERKVHEQARKVTNLLEMLGDNERKSVERWLKESEFAPFESGSGRRK